MLTLNEEKEVTNEELEKRLLMSQVRCGEIRVDIMRTKLVKETPKESSILLLSSDEVIGWRGGMPIILKKVTKFQWRTLALGSGLGWLISEVLFG